MDRHSSRRQPAPPVEARRPIDPWPMLLSSANGSLVGAAAASAGAPIAVAGPLAALAAAAGWFLARRAGPARSGEEDASERLWRMALDHHAIVSEADAEGRIRRVNDTFCAISGYRREELLGQDHRIVNSGRHPRAFWQEMYAALAREGVWHGEVCNRAKNGEEYWVATTNVAERDAQGRITRYVSIRADITARRRAEEALADQARDLAAARDAAEQASRAKSEFLANMSHEFRTPMTAILGFAEALADPDPSPEAADLRADALAGIRRQGEHLLGMIDRVLDLSDLESGSFRIGASAVSPRDIVQRAADRCRPRAEAKGLTLTVHDEPSLPASIRTDGPRLQQVLCHLIDNAIKFSERGEIVVQAGGVTTASGPTLRVRVQDAGIGMTLEQTRAAFAAFTQADASASRRFGGTGVGLSVAGRIVRLLGGSIEVASEVGHGSTFVVTLPSLPGSADSPAGEAAPRLAA